jgi:FkbM family methyltransferase
VFAFEPNPDVARRLTSSVGVNGLAEHVTIHADPLADVDGREVTLIIPNNHPGGAQIASVVPEGVRSVSARTRRLDSVPGAMDADLVKIDAEGMEESIWRGMTAMIAGPRLRYLVMEFNSSCYADPVRLIDEAVAAGFSLSCIDERRGVIPITRAQIVDGSRTQIMLLLRR